MDVDEVTDQELGPPRVSLIGQRGLSLEAFAHMRLVPKSRMLSHILAILSLKYAEVGQQAMVSIRKKDKERKDKERKKERKNH